MHCMTVNAELVSRPAQTHTVSLDRFDRSQSSRFDGMMTQALPEVGSSRKISFGAPTMPQAMLNRLFSPPDIPLTLSPPGRRPPTCSAIPCSPSEQVVRLSPTYIAHLTHTCDSATLSRPTAPRDCSTTPSRLLRDPLTFSAAATLSVSKHVKDGKKWSSCMTSVLSGAVRSLHGMVSSNESAQSHL